MAKLTRKLWIGIGAATLVTTGLGTTGAGAQHSGHGASAHPDAAASKSLSPTRADQGGEAYLSDGGPADARIRLLRDLGLIHGHLLVGNELVAAGRWDEALPHFLHPTEEIYDKIERYLTLHRVPAFDGQLKALAQTVRAQRAGAYQQALKVVNERLQATFEAFRKYMQPLPRITLLAAVELLKAAAGEYQSAIEGGVFAKPVEYQDSRGFVLHAEAMIDRVSRDLARTNAQALAQIRADLVSLKAAWPSPMPPPSPVIAPPAVSAIVAAIETRARGF